MRTLQGFGKEVYCVPASDYFVGKAFPEVVKIIYRNIKGILTIGVKTTHSKAKQTVLINPYNYFIFKGDKLFVISDNQETSDLITTYKSDEEISSKKENQMRIMSLEHAFLSAKIRNNTYKCNLEKSKVYYLWKDNLNGLISDHVVIFGSIEGLSTIVKAIRSYSTQPICLVNKNDPGSEWTKIIEQYDNLYYFKGSLLSYQDLYMAAVGECRSVLILASAGQSKYSPDSDAILASRLIDMSFPNTSTLVELSDESYIRFLTDRPKGKFTDMPYFTWPQHLSGGVFLSNYLDSLICQIFYNPDLNLILNKLIGFENPEREHEENSKIHTIKLPNTYFANNNSILYENLLTDLLEMKPPIIPIAIISRRMAEDTYVPNEILLINPVQSTVIKPQDSVICIGGSGKASKRNTILSEMSTISDSMNFSRPRSSSYNGSDCSDTDKDVIELLVSSLKHRLISDTVYKNKIESKSLTIQTLHKEVEELKTELVERS